MKTQIWPFFFFFLIASFNTYGQFADRNFYLVDSMVYTNINQQDRLLLDSTLHIYHGTVEDTSKLDLLNHIINNTADEKVWPLYNTYLKNYCNRLLVIGNNQTDGWYKKVLAMLAIATNNEGFLAYFQGDFKNALDRIYQSLNIRERIHDDAGIAECYNNLGGIHYSQQNFNEALDLFKKSLALKVKLDNKLAAATSYNNIGAIYNELNQLDSAESYYLKGLDIYLNLQDELGLGLIYHNLGSLYAKKNLIDKANWFFFRSISFNERHNEYNLLADSYYLLSKMYFNEERFDLTEKYGLIALTYAKKTGYPEDIRDAAGILNELYRKQGKYQQALEMHDLYVVMKDSSFNEKIKQEVSERNIEYEFEKKSYADSIRHADETRIQSAKISEQDAIINRDRTLKFSFGIGFVLLAALIVLILVALRNKKRANQEIEKQKIQVELQRDIIDEKHRTSIVQQKILEEQNREIKDSITYAKRLQEAILPSSNLVKKCLSDSFILYKPKDIVAGDFYWVEEVGDTVYFAAADCTGHGVPGAFVSVVCSNALNQAILELGASHPSDLLERVTDLVVKTFEKSNHIIKDGMDIALCAWNKMTNVVSYSGAYNPLWIVSSRTQLSTTTITFSHEKNVNTLHEIKATKQPVGKYTFKIPFEGHDIQLEKGDTIYLLSDGFADQFGGDKGKKFKYKQLKTLLLILSEYSMDEQNRQLNQTFEQWKGEFEQLDDICVLGVRV